MLGDQSADLVHVELGKERRKDLIDDDHRARLERGRGEADPQELLHHAAADVLHVGAALAEVRILDAFEGLAIGLEDPPERHQRVVLAVEDGGFFGGDRLEKSVDLQWRQSAYLYLGLGFTENVVDLPSGSFTSHLASLSSDLAFNSKWSWSNLVQYDNAADVFGINSRLRYIPAAGKELLLVLDHGGTIDHANHAHSSYSDLNLKVSYTFRY